MSEAQQFWESIVGKIKNLIRKETENTMRCERYEVSTAPNGTVMGVKKPYGAKELFLPYSQEVAGATVGAPVLVIWWGSMSNAKVYYYANGYSGHGIPAGGTTGQILGKNSGTDYDAGWKSATSLGLRGILYNGNKVSSGNIPLATPYTDYSLLVLTWITNTDIYNQIIDVNQITSTRNFFTDYAANAVGGFQSVTRVTFPNTGTITVYAPSYNDGNWTLGLVSVTGYKIF